MIQVVLPAHLRTLAHVGSEISIEVAGPVTLRSVLDALEATLSDAARDDSRPRHATSAARSCVFSPARKICRTNRPTLRCLRRFRPAKSHS